MTCFGFLIFRSRRPDEAACYTLSCCKIYHNNYCLQSIFAEYWPTNDMLACVSNKSSCAAHSITLHMFSELSDIALWRGITSYSSYPTPISFSACLCNMGITWEYKLSSSSASRVIAACIALNVSSLDLKIVFCNHLVSQLRLTLTISSTSCVHFIWHKHLLDLEGTYAGLWHTEQLSSLKWSCNSHSNRQQC